MGRCVTASKCETLGDHQDRDPGSRPFFCAPSCGRGRAFRSAFSPLPLARAFPSPACGRGQGEGALASPSPLFLNHIPVLSYRPSWPARDFLLLAQEKVTKEKGTLAAPAGFFLRALAAAEREPGRRKSRARPSRPQKHGLFLWGPSVARRRADGQGPRVARVRARDRAHSAAGQDVLSAEPGRP